MSLSGWSVILYNGNNGGQYGSIALSGSLPDQQNGTGTLAFSKSGLQNGASDGLALVDDSGAVVEFLSYEGTLTATDGAASGLTSVDIGVAESGTTPVGHSLQLRGSGRVASNFSWFGPDAASPGAVNTGQTFTAIPVADDGGALAHCISPSPPSPSSPS